MDVFESVCEKIGELLFLNSQKYRCSELNQFTNIIFNFLPQSVSSTKLKCFIVSVLLCDYAAEIL